MERLPLADLRLVRTLRLRALRDAPSAFAETEADALTQPDDYWLRLATSMTGSAPNAMLVARLGEDVVGSCYALVDGNDPDVGRIGGMWVDSKHRRHGVGRALVDAVRRWTERPPRTCLRLWVPVDASEARAFYAAAGFVSTNRERPFPSDPTRSIVEMELSLTTRW